MKKVKKILIYNWIHFDDAQGKGGGVSVYTKNLVGSLSGRGDCEVYFISSGRAYDILRRGVFIEPDPNSFGDVCKSFRVVNSPVLSSAHVNFPYVADCRQDRCLKKIFRKFIQDMGGFDVIHFQNLEGLSLGVLELKEEFPQTRFIYSLHNYYLFCPQVMLWKEDREVCMVRRCGAGCIACMPKDVHRWKVVFNQWIAYRRQTGKCSSGIWNWLQKCAEIAAGFCERIHGDRMSRRKKAELAHDLRKFREENVAYVNRYMDDILAVSGRVASLTVRYGIDKTKLRVCYIGTEAAERQTGHGRYPCTDGIFHICYLGYMRKAKGFYFLMDALEQFPESLAGKMKVTLAVKITDEKIQKRIEDMRKRFRDIEIYDGYTHEELPHILEGVQLGIVPPLWEDNLPQVAVEMKAYGIPVLTSDRGGAKELTRSKNFIFRAGDVQDFTTKLTALMDSTERLDGYWNDAPRLVTMAEHVEELMGYYNA